MRGEEGNPFLQYDMADRAQESKYPYWVDSAPNLQTFLTALNKSQPIIGCQFEMVWSRWPRTLFFAKKITIPGITVQTQDLSHAGFTIKIPTHATYESTEITLTIIADKEGFHYYDLRNMVIQTGHPLVAGDPKATIGNPFDISPTEDTIEVRLRNRPEDETHHHWIIHNFHPTGIGDMEMGHDSTGFVEFDLTGTFTHITYDCGKQLPLEPPEEEPNEEDVPSEPMEPQNIENKEESSDFPEDDEESDVAPPMKIEATNVD